MKTNADARKLRRKPRSARTPLPVLALFAISAALSAQAAAAPSAGGALAATRTKAQILERWNGIDLYFHEDWPYEREMKFTAPYDFGKVKDAYVAPGLAALNFARWLSGLPDDVVIDPSLNGSAQAAAFVNVFSRELTHAPSKPGGMDEAMFAVAQKGAKETNISEIRGWGLFRPQLCSYLGERVLSAWMGDENLDNVKRVGHRRMLLRPEMTKTGFGAAFQFFSQALAKGDFIFDGDRNDKQAEQDETRYSSFIYASVYVRDSGRKTTVNYDYVAWPTPGYFPAQFITSTWAEFTGYPWHVTPNPARYAKPDPNLVKVEMTRLRDGKKWTFDAKDTGETSYINPEDHELFSVDTQDASLIAPSVVFRPDTRSFKADAGEKYKVRVTGLKTKDGKPAVIEYATELMDISYSPLDRWAPVEDGRIYPAPFRQPAVVSTREKTPEDSALDAAFASLASLPLPPGNEKPNQGVKPFGKGDLFVRAEPPREHDDNILHGFYIDYGMLKVIGNDLWVRLRISNLPAMLDSQDSRFKPGEDEWLLGVKISGKEDYFLAAGSVRVKDGQKTTGSPDAVGSGFLLRYDQESNENNGVPWLPVPGKVYYRFTPDSVLLCLPNYRNYLQVDAKSEVTFSATKKYFGYTGQGMMTFHQLR